MANPTLTENVNAFDVKLYQSMSSTAAKYSRESDTGMLISQIPVAKGIKFNVNQYKKPILEESQGVSGGKPSLLQEQMTTYKNHKVYDLKNTNAYLYWDQDDVMEQAEFLSQEQDEQLAEWARQANLGIMKGIYTKGFNTDSVGQGSKLNYGVLDQATMVLNLNGTDSALNAAGDVYLALTNFVKAIPYSMRSGKTVLLGATPGFYDYANAALFTNDSGLTEWEQFYRIHAKGVSPLKVSENIIWSDDLFMDLGAQVGNEAAASTQYDCTDGSRNNAYTQETDVKATSDRLFAMVVDSNNLERAYSRGFGLMGEAKNYVGGITQTWTVKGAGCVHKPYAVLYSEKITWV